MNNGDRGVDTLVATDNLARTMRSDGVEDTLKVITGLTKREHFAGLAMQAFIAAGVNGMPSPDEVAFLATSYANALLKELEK